MNLALRKEFGLLWSFSFGFQIILVQKEFENKGWTVFLLFNFSITARLVPSALREFFSRADSAA
jgi:hypothetical protein